MLIACRGLLVSPSASMVRPSHPVRSNDCPTTPVRQKICELKCDWSGLA